MAISRTNQGVVAVTQAKRKLLVTKLTAEQLVRIGYVAQKGVSQERNAVQRLLTKSRIAGISAFAIAGGDFPNAIVLNWVNKSARVRTVRGRISIPLTGSSAQIIDGQHRFEGLKEAIKADSSIKKIEIPIALYMYLSVQECADIFLSINTEQKPVNPSLVYELYGVASKHIVNEAKFEAKQIADELNKRTDSAYYNMIRHQGAPRQTGGISLASVVNVLKPLVETNGAFAQVGIMATEQRLKVLLNWFAVLQDAYGSQWADKDNVFRYASGFWGSIEFFSNTMLKHCNLRNAFDYGTMHKAMQAFKDTLIWQKDVKGLQGRRSATTIAHILDTAFALTQKPRKTVRI